MNANYWIDLLVTLRGLDWALLVATIAFLFWMMLPRNLLTWRITEIPSDVSLEMLLAELKESAQAMEPLRTTLARISTKYSCATVTSLHKPDRYNVDQNFLGITPLFDPDRASVDIVALTGLGGHAIGSFKSRNSWKVWLRDFLPEDIPDARVLIYGYNTTLVQSTLKSSIEDLAKSLLEQLKAFRAETQTQQRPLVFIGHSLGGLLVKEALAIAKNNLKNADSLAFWNSTYGLVFFGVPNLGLRYEQLRTIVKGQPNRYLVDSLVVDEDSEPSHYLSGLTQKFIETCEAQKPSFEIVSYYERKTSRTVELSRNGKLAKIGPPILLVTEQSARRIGGSDNFYQHFPLEADHSDMVKFDNLQDSHYRMVVSQIKELVRKAPMIVQGRFSVRKDLTPDQKPIWNSLNQPPYSAVRDGKKIPEREAGTLEWIVDENIDLDHDSNPWLAPCPGAALDQATFTAWRDSNTSGSLLIQGSPGQGKSVLANFVVSHLQYIAANKLSTRAIKVIYYFCNIKDEASSRTATSVVRALIVQLCKEPHLFQLLPEIFITESSKFFSASLSTLLDIFRQVLTHDAHERVYCVIDGLDVYRTEMDELSARLKDIFNSQESANKPLLKLFCTSRPNNPVSQAFHGSPERSLRPNPDDLRTVIDASVRSLPSNFTDKMKAKIKKELCDKSGATFLWIDIIMRRIQQIEMPTPHKIQTLFESSPKELERLYDALFSEVQKKDPEFRTLVLWVVQAKDALCLEALADAIAFDSDSAHQRYADYYEHRPSLTPETVRRHVGTLVDVIGDKVYLIHQSVKDYFENKQTNDQHEGHHRVNVGRACLRYLALEDFAQGHINEKNNLDSDIEQKYPLLRYAATNWFSHIRTEEEIHNDLPLLKKIVSPKTGYAQVWMNIFNQRSFLWDTQLPQKPSEVPIKFNIGWLAKIMLNKVQGLGDDFDEDSLEKLGEECFDVLEVLLTDGRAANLKVSPRVTELVAGARGHNRKFPIQLLLTHRNAEVEITTKVVTAALRNYHSGGEVIKIIFQERGKNVEITTEMVTTIAKTFDHSVMELLLRERGQDIEITTEVVTAAAENWRSGKKVMKLLLRERGQDAKITTEVVTTVAKTFDHSVMELLLRERGQDVEITTQVVTN